MTKAQLKQYLQEILERLDPNENLEINDYNRNAYHAGVHDGSYRVANELLEKFFKDK